ncbi:MAG: LpxI family protein, partial [Pseudolabrys sp.]
MSDRHSDLSAPLAIVCGGGAIPFAVADSLQAQGRSFVLFGISGVADAGRISAYPHYWVGLGQLGRFMRLARTEGCREVAFIGALKRPALWAIGFDLKALLYLPQVIAAFRGGDDHLLTSVGRLIEAEGFRVIGAHEVAPQVLMPNGVLTRLAPSPRDQADIARALQVLFENSALDRGQAAVVADGNTLVLEGSGGTDSMMEQLAGLRAREG